MHCTQCGAEVPDGARFCAACGANTFGTTATVARTRPLAVTLLAILKILTSLGWLLIALLFTFTTVSAGSSTNVPITVLSSRTSCVPPGGAVLTS